MDIKIYGNENVEKFYSKLILLNFNFQLVMKRSRFMGIFTPLKNFSLIAQYHVNNTNYVENKMEVKNKQKLILMHSASKK